MHFYRRLGWVVAIVVMAASSGAFGQSAATSTQGTNESALRTAGKGVMIAGVVLTVAGIAVILASAEGHSPLGDCADCGPAGVALGSIVSLGGFVVGATGLIMYAAGNPPASPPTAPRGLALGVGFRF